MISIRDNHRVSSIIDSPLPRNEHLHLPSEADRSARTYDGDLFHVVFLNGASQVFLDRFLQDRRAFIVGQLQDLFHSIANVLGLDLRVTKG